MTEAKASAEFYFAAFSNIFDEYTEPFCGGAHE